MDLDDYQHKAAGTSIYADNIKVMYPALGLTGEAGEVANKIKKVYRDKGGEFVFSDREQIGAEIGDVLWYLANLCSDLGLSLSEEAQRNLDKLNSRMARGVIGGSGDAR